MRILIATDSFPPDCGGSGWSTYELARGLRARGHHVVIVQALAAAARRARTEYDGFHVRPVRVTAPDIPYLRNYLKQERSYPRLAAALGAIIRTEGIDLVHGQHVLTCPPAVRAGAATGIATVCTVRDYWPVCYWSTLIHDFASDRLCPGCSPMMMTRCIRPRAGAAWPLALPFIPYMARNLARKRQALRHADAVIAVSGSVADDLRQRAPELAATRLETIPNPVDVSGTRTAVEHSQPPLAGPYALYVGKLAPNKGVDRLLPAVAQAGLPWPLIVVGDGPDRAALEAEARRRRLNVGFTGWLARHQTLVWMRHAALLVFPSRGPESLSRVLLEATCLGVPVAAMDTGGTRDIITHEVTGLLSHDPQALAGHIERLVSDSGLRKRLAGAARASTPARFDASVVVARVELLYQEILAARRERRHRV